MRIKLTFLFLAVFGASAMAEGREAAAGLQTPGRPLYWQANAGIGLSSPQAALLGMGFTIEYAHVVSSVRLLRGLSPLGPPAGDFAVFEAGLLAGYGLRSRTFALSAAAGISYLRIETGNWYYVAVPDRVVGVPLELRLSGILSPRFGLSLCLFATINRVEYFGGARIEIEFGRLR